MAQRDDVTAALSALSAEHGAWAVRVHDVAKSRAAVIAGNTWREYACIPLAPCFWFASGSWFPSGEGILAPKATEGSTLNRKPYQWTPSHLPAYMPTAELR